MPAPTTTSPSRSPSRSCSPGCARCCAGSPPRRRRRPRRARCWPSPTSPSTSPPARSAAASRSIELTRTEFTLLEMFLRRPRRVLDRSFILEEVWGYDFPTTANSLEVYVGYLRRKTEAEGEPRLIHTVRGVGYVLKESLSATDQAGWAGSRYRRSLAEPGHPADHLRGRAVGGARRARGVPHGPPPAAAPRWTPRCSAAPRSRRSTTRSATRAAHPGVRRRSHRHEGRVRRRRRRAPTVTPGPGSSDFPLGHQELAVARGTDTWSCRTISADGVDYRVATVRTIRKGWALVVAQSLESNQSTLGTLGLVMLIFGAAGVLAAGLAGWAVARNGLRPVRRLTDAAEDIARTEQLDPIEVEGNDEIARLARAFNAMLTALSASRDRQRQLVADAGHELRTPLTSLRTNLDLLTQADRQGGLSEAVPRRAARRRAVPDRGAHHAHRRPDRAGPRAAGPRARWSGSTCPRSPSGPCSGSAAGPAACTSISRPPRGGSRARPRPSSAR